MSLSVFDLLKIGIGPSSSHTVGPMRAALSFVEQLKSEQKLSQVNRVKGELFGSLGATGMVELGFRTSSLENVRDRRA